MEHSCKDFPFQHEWNPEKPFIQWATRTPDGWMFELFIDAQPQNDYKITIFHNVLDWKKTKEIQD